jgi:hypothetical protein
MADGYMLQAQVASFIPELVLESSLGRLKNLMTFTKHVTKSVDLTGGSAFTVGQTLDIPIRGAIVANSKTPGQPYTVQAPTGTQVKLTLDHYWEVTFGIESLSLAFVNSDIMKGYLEDAAIALSEQIEKSVFDLAGTVPGLYPSQVYGTAGVPVNEAVILQARAALVDAKVAATEKRYGIFSPNHANELLALPRLTSWSEVGVASNVPNATIGDGANFDGAGAIGRAYGIDMYESQLVESPAGVAQNVIFAKNAIVFASRALESVPDQRGAQVVTMVDEDTGVAMRAIFWFNPSVGGHTCTLEALWGVSLMRSNQIVVIQS